MTTRLIERDTSLLETEREAVILARWVPVLSGQRIVEIEHSCRVTKVENPAHLRPSHAKPWCDCNNDDKRLDGENGLLLTPSIDHLFDRRFITFEDSGRLVLSPAADRASLDGMGVPQRETVKRWWLQRGTAVLSGVSPQLGLVAGTPLRREKLPSVARVLTRCERWSARNPGDASESACQQAVSTQRN